MERQDSLERIDHNILQILDRYESLETRDLWYELGEEDIVPEGVTEQEVLSRLEFMNKKGFVKCIREPGANLKWSVVRN